MNETCSIENIEFCGDPPISFASKEAICKEGSLTVLLALFFFCIAFAVVHLIHHLREDKLQVKGLYDREEKKNEKKSVKSSISNFVESILVKPFVPSSAEGFVVGIFFVWFCLTVPMALTRYYESKWGQNELALQGPLNVLSWALGCEGFEMDILTYTKDLDQLPHPFQKPKLLKRIFRIFRRRAKVMDTAVDPEMEHYKQVDWIFTTHLIFGLIWLSSGFFQIFMIKAGWSTIENVRILSHRWFGRIVAVPSVLLHVCAAAVTALRNPVNQKPVITLFYLAAVVSCFIDIGYGMKFAVQASAEENKDKKEKLRNRHKTRMGTLYIGSISGSGAIRLAVWVQWLFGKFFSQKTRMHICRAFCQEYSSRLGKTERGFLGDADNCWESVFINLTMMDLLNGWLTWLYYCMLKRDGDLEPKDETAMKVKASSFINSLGALLFIYFVELSFDSKVVDKVVPAYLFILYFKNSPLQHWIAHEIHWGRNKKPEDELTFTQSLAENLHGYAIHEHDADDEHEKED